jgi:hypothetical protein
METGQLFAHLAQVTRANCMRMHALIRRYVFLLSARAEESRCRDKIITPTPRGLDPSLAHLGLARGSPSQARNLPVHCIQMLQPSNVSACVIHHDLSSALLAAWGRGATAHVLTYFAFITSLCRTKQS